MKRNMLNMLPCRVLSDGTCEDIVKTYEVLSYYLLLRIDLSIFPFTITNRGSKTTCFLLLAVQKRTKEHTHVSYVRTNRRLSTEEFLRLNTTASQTQMCLTKESMYKTFIKQDKKSPKLSLRNLQGEKMQ